MPRAYGHASVSVLAVVKCEGCGHTFQTPARISGKGRSGGVIDSRVLAEAKEQARSSLALKIDSVKQGNYTLLEANTPCPQCGYLQSWMIPTRKRRHISGWFGFRTFGIPIIIIGALLACMLAQLVTGTGGSGYMAGAAVAAVLALAIAAWRTYVSMFYNPNRPWLKQRGLTSQQIPAQHGPLDVQSAGGEVPAPG